MSRKVKAIRTAAWPELETILKTEILEHRQRSRRIKRWWIINRALQLKEQMDPSNPLTFSTGWFNRFLKRNALSYRTGTSAAQHPPTEKVDTLREFHKFIRKNATRGATKKQKKNPLGKWKECVIANMDQTPMPFVFGGGKTYSSKGEKSIWIRGGQSEQDKRQCTVQLTIFADGESRIKPMVIFRGKWHPHQSG